MSIVDKLVSVNRSKIALRSIIIGKGVDVPEDCPFRDLADRVADINGATAYDHNVAAPAWMPPKLARLFETRLLIKNAIQAKGADPGDNLAEYVWKIAALPGGRTIAYYPTADELLTDPALEGFFPVRGGKA
jgi:hypothetical protein